MNPPNNEDFFPHQRTPPPSFLSCIQTTPQQISTTRRTMPIRPPTLTRTASRLYSNLNSSVILHSGQLPPLTRRTLLKVAAPPALPGFPLPTRAVPPNQTTTSSLMTSHPRTQHSLRLLRIAVVREGRCHIRFHDSLSQTSLRNAHCAKTPRTPRQPINALL